MVGVGRDLCGSSSPALLPKQGHLQQAAQDLVQAGLEYLQRRRLEIHTFGEIRELHKFCEFCNGCSRTGCTIGCQAVRKLFYVLLGLHILYHYYLLLLLLCYCYYYYSFLCCLTKLSLSPPTSFTSCPFSSPLHWVRGRSGRVAVWS